MPCFSRIINTSMKLADRIIDAAKSFGWEVDQVRDNIINIKTKTTSFQLYRYNAESTFQTRDRAVDEHLQQLQKQYNVEVTKGWANRMGYKSKEKKEEVKI